MVTIIMLSVIGFALSLYTYHLEQKIKEDPTYHPMCNISDRVSCTKPITSPYGKLFGFSNSILGLIFYPVLGILALLDQPRVLFITALGLLLFTAYLANILFTKVKAICPVCIAIYILNGTIALVCLLQLP